MKSYNAIDLMRFVAALFVISIHTDPFLDLSPAFNYIWVSGVCRVAVPFFFMASGYFFFKKLDGHSGSGEKQTFLLIYAKKLLKLYVLWSLIYLPLQAMVWLAKGGGWQYWGEYLQKFFFEGSYYTLWYLPSLLFAVVFSYCLFKFLKPKFVMYITFTLFVAGTLLQSYYDLFQQQDLLSWYYALFLTTRNGLFFGSFFVSAGIYLAMFGEKRKPRKDLWYCILFFLFLLLEVSLLRGESFTKGNGMWLMLAPAVYFLFSFLRNAGLRNRPIYRMLRPISFLMYVSHGLFLLTVGIVFQMNSFLYSTAIVVLSFLFSIGFIYIGKKNRFIRQLY
ncbi:acyltransferase [Bacillus sp. 1P06AnD]|uniref:acyltransferase n=1 Tax=Bacillus sp. 1P06AnD TaxID=3132208 RepID=UPI0039A008F5